MKSVENLGKKYDAAAEAEAAKNIEQLMTLEELRSAAVEIADEANVAIMAKNTIGYADALNRVSKVIEEYADLAQRKIFSEFREKANPQFEAAKVRYYTVIAVKVINDPKTKMPLRVEIHEKDKMIDLLKLCEFCALPTVWWTNVAAYCQWLALQVSDNIGMSEGYKQELIKKFRISEDAKAVDMHRFSKSEKVKTLQDIIDEMVFVPGKTEGMNALRVNNYDVEYVSMCLTREGKGSGVVKFIDDKGLRRILMNVCHRLAINGVYTLSYKEIRPKAVPTAPVISEKVVTPAKAEESAEKPAEKKARKPRSKKAEVVEVSLQPETTEATADAANA